jgi:hypothetical protein
MISVDEVKQFVREGHTQRGSVFNPVKFETEFANLVTTRKMITRFLKTGVINDKLITNNVICALNAFGIVLGNRAFRMLCTDKQFEVVKAILMFIGCQYPHVGPDIVPNRIIVDILRDVARRYHLEHL